jgi:hypothetical protein
MLRLPEMPEAPRWQRALGATILAGGLAFTLAFWLAVGYVLWHFLRKFW